MLTLSQIDRFEEIIDVRSPVEYADDHIPGAHNFPALSDKERSHIGTLYKQISAFEAKKQGASLIAENFAGHLREHLNARDDNWRPLVYCQRGGERSAAFTHILKKIGWPAVSLPGGYKAYRSMVRTTIDDIAPKLKFKVLCGRTGVGKSRLLNILAQEKAAQALNLEQLANHRGSVLGNLLHEEQPSQKYFESLLCKTLRRFNPKLPTYVEAESRKIGKIHIPTTVLNAIRAAECICIETGLKARVEYLLNEYQHFLTDRTLLKSSLALLIPFLGVEKINRWTHWKTHRDAENMVIGLLNEHYDPIYLNSMKRHFTHYSRAAMVRIERITDNDLRAAALKISDGK